MRYWTANILNKSFYWFICFVFTQLASYLEAKHKMFFNKLFSPLLSPYQRVSHRDLHEDCFCFRQVSLYCSLREICCHCLYKKQTNNTNITETNVHQPIYIHRNKYQGVLLRSSIAVSCVCDGCFVEIRQAGWGKVDHFRGCVCVCFLYYSFINLYMIFYFMQMIQLFMSHHHLWGKCLKSFSLILI